MKKRKTLSVKIPKRIAGVKIPKTVRKGPVADFLNSSGGQVLIAEALLLAARSFAGKRVDPDSRWGNSSTIPWRKQRKLHCRARLLLNERATAQPRRASASHMRLMRACALSARPWASRSWLSPRASLMWMPSPEALMWMTSSEAVPGHTTEDELAKKK